MLPTSLSLTLQPNDPCHPLQPCEVGLEMILFSSSDLSCRPYFLSNVCTTGWLVNEQKSLFSSRNKTKLSRKKMQKANSKSSVVLVHSVFEDMEEVSLVVCTEGTEYIFLCFCNHNYTVSTPRLGPLAVTAKLYQWITVIISGSFIGNEVKLHLSTVQSLTHAILKWTLITLTAPGRSEQPVVRTQEMAHLKSS